MAVVRPFRGVRYDAARVTDLSKVVTQPFDRISQDLQTRYHDLHPQNYVRLIRGRSTPNDTETDNIYTRAHATYEEWLSEGVLVQDESAGLYLCRQTFRMPDGSIRTRTAFLSALELTPFGEGIVLPHEGTLAGPKTDRLNLLRATAINFEPIFMLYPDPSNRIISILDDATSGCAPDAEMRELHEQDVQQKLWVIRNPAVIERVRSEMAPKRRLIIADGHNRYVTALNYRDEMRLAHPNASAEAPWNHALTALVSMEDPGLVILPTHRLVHSYTGMSADQLRSRAADYFDITPVADRELVVDALSSVPAEQHAFGFACAGQQYLWVLRDVRVMNRLAPERVPAWRLLDVSILHELVLEKLLGLTKDSIARQENLAYLRETEPGYRALDQGEAQFLFLLNPTRMSQVAACAEAGEQMPQKSTDFYPKMISGLVAFPLG